MQKKHSIRTFFNGRGYYIVLAVCILAVGVSALIFYRTVADVTGEGEPDQSLSVPAVAQEQPQTDKPASDGGKKDVPTVSLDDPAPAEVPAAALMVCSPVEGEPMVGFSVDALAYNETMGDWRTHNGIDYAAPLGAKVCAVTDGVVAAIYEDDYLGTVVKIEHSDGWSTLYANLTAVPSVSAGDAVKAGQVIGAVGQTAMLEVSARPHLHLEVYRYGTVTDPALLLG